MSSWPSVIQVVFDVSFQEGAFTCHCSSCHLLRGLGLNNLCCKDGHSRSCEATLLAAVLNGIQNMPFLCRLEREIVRDLQQFFKVYPQSGRKCTQVLVALLLWHCERSGDIDNRIAGQLFHSFWLSCYKTLYNTLSNQFTSLLLWSGAMIQMFAAEMQ